MTATDLSRRPAPIGDRPSPGGGHGLSLIRLVNVTLRSRATVVGIALLVAAAVVMVGLARPRTYSAAAAFFPQGRMTGSNLSGLAAQFGINIQSGEGAQSPQFYADLLASRAFLKDAAEHRYELGTGPTRRTGTLADIYGIRASSPALRTERAVDRLQRELAVSVAPKTGVVTITARTRDPELSAAIAARLLALLDEFNQETRQSQAAAERRFTERRLDEVRAELRAAEDRLTRFLASNRGSFRNAPELQFEYDRLQREVSLRQSLYTSLVQAYEQARIDEVRDTPVITVVQRPEAPVRPDRRLLLQKGIVGLVLGLALGIVIVLLRHALAQTEEATTDEMAEFAALRRATVDDLMHPWRPVQRLFGRGRSVRRPTAAA